ncbi:MAG: WcaF family extracellular polysaccharide biosynthesis acetyltransferase [Nitrospira sp.]|nr:WcaF family extracellular polysaccharide biosynthesis acetyltransferase [Nitrospira sp.]
MPSLIVLGPSLADYVPGQYDPGARWFKRGCWYFINAFIFRSCLFPLSSVKACLLRIFGAHIGKRLVIKPRVNIKHPWRLIIDDDVWIGEEVWIDNLVPVHIGSNVCLSQGALVLTGSHDYSDPSFRLTLGEVHLEDGAWVAARSMVCPGVRCGRNAVITAGSVLRKDAEPDGVYAGNPAVLVRSRVIRNKDGFKPLAAAI